MKNNHLRKKELSEAPKKIGAYFLYGAVGIGIVGGIGWFIATRPSLPPTTMQGHIEESPKAHISDTPISEAIQRHMLEHADGKSKPGILIQYNCKKYSCADGLVAKLTALTQQYPDNVYLAPNNYDGKIILTKLDQLKILDGFDEQAIKDFIR